MVILFNDDDQMDIVNKVLGGRFSSYIRQVKLRCRSGYFEATVEYQQKTQHHKKSGYAAGISTWSVYDAIYKATMKTFERLALERAPQGFCQYVECKNLDMPFIDPRTFVPLTPDQCKEHGVNIFYEENPYAWLTGTDAKGRSVAVLADMCYYKIANKSRVAYASASGVAAGVSEQGAVQRGLAELIERGVILKAWYEQVSPLQIDYWDVRSDKVVGLVRYWENKGVTVHILRFSSEYLPVYMVVITDYRKPFLAIGAAACFGRSPEETIAEAVEEADVKMHYYRRWLSARKDERRQIEQMLDLGDNGWLYAMVSTANRQRDFVLKYLLSGERLQPGTIIDDSFALSFEEAMRATGAITARIDNKNLGIPVMRVFSPELVPVGPAGVEYYAHSVIETERKLDLPLRYFP